MKENFAEVLESYTIAEEGLFSKLKEKRAQNLAKVNAEKAAKMELWKKEKFTIKKIIESSTTNKKKEYKGMKVNYTFDPKKFSFGDDDMLPIEDPKCDNIYVEYNESTFEDDNWNNFFYSLFMEIKEKISKSIKSNVNVYSYDDCIIEVRLSRR